MTATAGDDGRAWGGEAARTTEELATQESSGDAAVWKSCGGARDGCGGARDGCGDARGSCGGGEGVAALENSASRWLGFGVRRIETKTATDVRLKRLRSAFHAMTGRGGRLTERDGAASGQSPVSSWRDRTRPVRDDRTLTESGQSLPGNPTRMTGHGGGGHNVASDAASGHISLRISSG
jgi:hypothetical protein